jgi:hypothetical protein
MTAVKRFGLRMAGALFVLVFGTCLAMGAENEASPPTAAADILIGTWKVDLRPTPDSEPYFKEFVVRSVQGNAFTGTFYDTEISQARINTDWGKLRIAFVTADGSGAYHHSAVLDADKLEGMTNATGRDFLSYWSAVKQ